MVQLCRLVACHLAQMLVSCDAPAFPNTEISTDTQRFLQTFEL